MGRDCVWKRHVDQIVRFEKKEEPKAEVPEPRRSLQKKFTREKIVMYLRFVYLYACNKRYQNKSQGHQSLPDRRRVYT